MTPIVIEARAGDDLAALLAPVFADISSAWDNASFRVPLMLFSKEIERFEEGLFSGEHAPDGTPWAVLAVSTVRRKGHDVILHETGRLGSSLFGTTGDSIRDIGDRWLTFGTSVEYASWLDTGTKRMPGRPMVGLDEGMCDLAAEYLADGAVVALSAVP